MIGHSALCIEATETRTGISASLLNTSSGLATLRADKTLWSTVGRSSYHTSLTRTDADTIALSELTVGSTGVGVTRVYLLHHRNSCWYERTLSDGVSSVTQQTCADWLMSVGVAHSIDTTHSWTRIHTLVVDTSSVSWTVSVEDTLRSASQVRITKVTWDAGTSACSLLGFALSI